MHKCIDILHDSDRNVLLIEHNSIIKTIVNNSSKVIYKNGTSQFE